MTWDDPGNPLSSYKYRIRDTNLTWTDWVEIKDPGTTLPLVEEKLLTQKEIHIRIAFSTDHEILIFERLLDP